VPSLQATPLFRAVVPVPGPRPITVRAAERHTLSAYQYLPAAFRALAAMISAARAGFWYAEQMRLTGRRPPAGGPLRGRPDPTETSGR
jgi:hypothetical protein